MNTKFIASVITLSLTFTGIFFSSCTKEEMEVNESTANIHGEWKLIAVYYWDGEPLRLDYYQNNIIYDFDENNILTVWGEMGGIDDYRGYEKGRYSYETLPISMGPHFSSPQMKIDAEIHGFSFGWVFYDFYEGPAMHLNTKEGTLVLVNR